MSTLLRKTRTGFFMAMIGMLIMSVLAPVLTLANDDLQPGDDAVALRDSYLYSEYRDDANIEAEVAVDTPVTIEDGPLYSPLDGTPWYQVRISEDRVGYMPGVDLEGETIETTPVETTDTATEEESAEPSAPAIPWQQPIDYAVATADVTCRGGTSTGAAEITTVPVDTTIEITGAEVWAEGIGWTPVNCAGVGGYIASDYIAHAVETEEPVVEAPATEAVVEQPAETVEEPVDPATTGETVTEEVAEAPVPEVQPAAAPIATAWAADAVNCRMAPTVESEAIAGFAASDAIPVTGEAFEAEGLSWTPVNCGGVGGFVATDFLVWEDPAAAVEAPAEDVTAEATAPVEVATEAATQPVEETQELAPAEEEAAVEEATEAPAEPTEVATEEPAAATEAPATTVVEEAPKAPAEEATEEASETPATPTEETEATEEATEEPAADATEMAPEDAAEEATEAPVEETPAVESGVAVEETESTVPVEDSAIIGTAEVTGTNGMGLACRVAPEPGAPVIATLPEGMGVFVLSEPDANGWMSIVCSDQVGYAPSTYLYSGGAASEFTSSSPSLGTVASTGGAGLNCRSGPSTGHSIIGYFPAGSSVNVSGAAQGDWVPVVCGGNQNGWVHGDFLTAASAPSGNTGGTSSTGTATVVNTSGDSLRCRSGAGTSYSIITNLMPGATVSLRSGSQGDWQAVVCAGQNGFAHSDYLSVGGAAPTNPTSPTNGSGTGKVTGTATVVNTSGDSLRCRSGAGTSYSTITYLAPGSSVNLRSGSQGDWQAVVCAGQNGFAHSDYLSTGGGGSTPDPEPEPAPGGFGNGDHARTTANLNLRYDPYVGNNVAAVAPQGTVVLVTGGEAGNGYVPVNWDGLKGYMSSDFLIETNEALSERGGSGAPTDPPTSGGGGGTATGNAIADYAMGYLGYPYVWATHGPASFDCSGFTYWVIYNVTGKNIWYGLWTQIAAGTPVSRGALQPGDLVFFQNTYKAGLSHVGIYIGNNKFIHAQNEATGVVISDLDSSYYGPRWYGARRIN